MTSMLPLEITVRWYTPGTLVVTEAEWKGGTVPTVQLTVPELPEDANVWGEVSADGGETWSRWEDEAFFFIVDIEAEGKACVFVVSWRGCFVSWPRTPGRKNTPAGAPTPFS